MGTWEPPSRRMQQRGKLYLAYHTTVVLRRGSLHDGFTTWQHLKCGSIHSRLHVHSLSDQREEQHLPQQEDQRHAYTYTKPLTYSYLTMASMGVVSFRKHAPPY